MINTTGERALLLAMIERAIVDAAKPIENVAKETQREALQWLKYSHPEDTNIPFTYLWACEHLGIDPNRLRRFSLQCIKRQDVDRFTLKPLMLMEFLETEDDAEYEIVGVK